MICGTGDRLVMEVEKNRVFELVCYQLPECKELFRLRNNTSQSSLLVPSPRGRYLLVAYRQTAEDSSPLAKCLDLQTGTVRYALDGVRTPPTYESCPMLRFSADDRYLFRELDNHAVAVLRADSGIEERKLVGHQTLLRAMATTPDGSFLVTLGAPATIIDDPARDLVQTEDNSTVMVWDLRQPEPGRSGAPPRKQRANLADGPDPNHPSFPSWRFQETFADARLPLFEGQGDAPPAPQQKEPQRAKKAPFPKLSPGLAKSITSGIIHPAGWVVTGHQDGTARVWRRSDERLLLELRAGTQPVCGVALSADGGRLAASCEPVRKQHPEPADPKLAPPGDAGTVSEFQGPPPELPGDHPSIYGEPGDIVSNATVTVWNVHDMKSVEQNSHLSLRGKTNDLAAGLAFSPTGTKLILGPLQALETRWEGNWWFQFAVWNLDAEQQLRVLSYKSTYHAPFRLSWDADESRVAFGELSGTFHIVFPDRPQEVKAFVGHQGQVTGIAFHPSGQRFASIGADRTIQVFDPRLKTPLLKLPYRGGVPDGVRFLDDGLILEVTDRDGGVVRYPTAAKSK